ncbi:MAG: hypothetical protein ACE5HW_05060, partial [Candidatus Methanofastidiosia archaeon]
MKIQSKVLLFMLIFAGALHLIGAQKNSDWIEYESNPVFDPDHKAYYPSIIYDSNKFSGNGDSYFYKMWYATSTGIRLAYSDDGISWTEYGTSDLGTLTNANHPFVIYDENGFGGTSVKYKIGYWDTGNLYTINAIRYAESQDGMNWTNDQAITQVLSTVVDNSNSSNWNRGTYGPGQVIYNPSGSSTLDDTNIMNNRYIMYYDATTGGFESIGLAYSADGKLWKGHGEILPRGNTGPWGNTDTWDSSYTYRATVILFQGVYHMWYSGATGGGGSDYYAHGIGHATSQDGLNWVRDEDNPLFHKDDGVLWRDKRTYTPLVIYDENGFASLDECNFKMWFTGKSDSNYAIGYATLCISQRERRGPRYTFLYSLRPLAYSTINY